MEAAVRKAAYMLRMSYLTHNCDVALGSLLAALEMSAAVRFSWKQGRAPHHQQWFPVVRAH